ncbi:hypothetical protein M0804_015403 [Polistes exclamans]|nr:hypothetical protein M0804_015404 [Polistes exclamans]KAI4473311.1 hypothetical protein M0804_015403 [Polistes exclamans]
MVRLPQKLGLIVLPYPVAQDLKDIEDNDSFVSKMISPRRLDSEGPAGGGGGGGGGSKDDDNGTKAFLSTGRTGRRNALPDIHGKHAATSISDLPDRFGELSTETDHGMNAAAREANNQPGVSKQHVG